MPREAPNKMPLETKGQYLRHAITDGPTFMSLHVPGSSAPLEAQPSDSIGLKGHLQDVHWRESHICRYGMVTHRLLSSPAA